MNDSRLLPHQTGVVFLALALLLAVLIFFGCSREPGDASSVTGRRFIVIGIDGAEWRVVKDLWKKGHLPNLRALADRGTSAVLRTAYNSSPVIWTTIATGVVPQRHGITGFVVATEGGDVPVSSHNRKVPAIWNMLTFAQRRVAVLGWWASWPAEQIHGVVVSDRALLAVENGFYAPEIESEIELMVQSVGQEQLTRVRVEEIAKRKDLLTSLAAERLVGEEFDLMLVYFRDVDVMSHRYWKYYEPERFDVVDAAELDMFARKIPDAYQEVDRQIGKLVEAAKPETNFLVISDHGFHAREQEGLQIGIDFDRLLQRFGFQVRSETEIDMTRSELFTYASGKHQRQKKVRYALRGRDPGGSVEASERTPIRRRLEASLARARYETGAAIFRVRDATPEEGAKGADFVAEVLTESASPQMFIDGVPFEKGIGWFAPISGGHSPDTHGMIIAAGPDIRPGAALKGITIKDITPTLLYGLGLPVARDFDGRPRLQLFTERFRREQPVRRIDSWGTIETDGVLASPADEQILEELRALGYIN